MKYTAYITSEAGNGIRETGIFSRDEKAQENGLIKLYPEHRDQVWDGFGGAVTDSAAYVWSLMSDAQKDELIQRYFEADGLRYSFVRVPIDSCDFSLEPYEASPDGDPSHFDMTRPFKYILPMLEAIREHRDVRLMLSPWSPPAVFKTNGMRQHGGKCRREHLDGWAEYICRYIQEFEERGFRVERISLQNEPNAVQTWDSCVWSGEEEWEFLAAHMKPALIRHGFENVEVYIWDHNKERVLDRAEKVLSGGGEDCADGIAFHWYSGDHFDALRMTHERFPEKKLLLSENCIEYSKYDAKDASLARKNIAHEIIGDLESGTNAFFDWNLVLDEKGGPNYVGNYCHAPFLYDTGNGRLEEQSIYWALWHFARFIRPGSQRILTSKYTAEVEGTAFLREDDVIVLVLQNTGEEREVTISLAGEIASLTLPVHSLATVLIERGNV